MSEYEKKGTIRFGCPDGGGRRFLCCFASEESEKVGKGTNSKAQVVIVVLLDMQLFSTDPGHIGSPKEIIVKILTTWRIQTV